MAYLGSFPSVGEFQKLDDISSQFNNTDTVFNLTVAGSATTVVSAQSLIISVDGIVQEPQVAYTTGGSTITFSEAPTTSSTFFGVILGDVNQVGVPADNLISSAKIQNNAITESKIAANAVTESKISGTLAVTKGGLSTSALAANSLLVGNSTATISVIPPGANNNVLRSDGVTWSTANIIPTLTSRLYGTIATPTVSVTGGPTNVIAAPNITSSAFSVTGNALAVTHVSTDWQVIRTSNSQVVFERIANTTNLVSISLPLDVLQANTQYEFKAKHNSFLAGNSAFGSNVSNTQVVFTIPSILGQSIGGGFYTGTINIGGGVCYYLIVAPNATGCACCQWKTTRTATSGTTSESNGFANTRPPMENAGHPAGNWTATRTIGGFSDWYLPAPSELQVMYNNRSSMPAGEGFTTDVDATRSYWASREYSATYGCVFDPLNNISTRDYKNLLRRVRAIRRVSFL